MDPLERDSNHVPIQLEPGVQQAIAVIKSTYNDEVSIKQKGKSLLKFGRNDNLSTTEQTVWLQGGIETLPTGNTIDTISSSNAGDTQEVIIEGHTLSGSDLTFVIQSATLNGQNKVVLDTPLYRSTRIYNNDSTDFAGTVYVYEDDTVTGGVPQTADKIHLQSSGSNNQSLKCSTSLSKDDYWIITEIIVSVNRQNSRSVDFRLQMRDFGKVFRTRLPLSCHSESGTIIVPLNPAIIARPNSDIRVNAISSGTATGVNAAINGYLAVKTNT